ncbi:MAG: SDR family oxidoreductase [Verrucomicrobia bacterium]|nr:SDR family oxidoreductase [Verrucomicrobiota bacterium]
MGNLQHSGIVHRSRESGSGVAQASSPASSPGVPPGVSAGSGTLPQLAAGTGCTTRILGRLENKVAWISGATSGIGEATARLFAREGAKVALVGRRLAVSRQIAGELKVAGGEALSIACDVSNERQVHTSIRRTVEHFGRLDIIVNNAGLVHIKALHEYTERQWDHVMSVNVKSMFFATKHAIPHLRRSGRGCIVNVGSISSFVGQALTPVYTTTKHAVVGLTKSIALDYAADGIRCNCVCPGITDTPMLREHLNATADPEATLRNRLRRVPMGVSLTPHDVAKTILFLSCEDSSGITGTTLVIDAGYLTAAEWETHGRTAFMAGGKSGKGKL